MLLKNNIITWIINFQTTITNKKERKISANEVYAKVNSIIVEQLGVKEENLKPEASFIDDLGADSLDTVELVMALEEEFDTEIPDEDAEKIKTVKDVYDYIDAKVN